MLLWRLRQVCRFWQPIVAVAGAMISILVALISKWTATKLTPDQGDGAKVPYSKFYVTNLKLGDQLLDFR